MERSQPSKPNAVKFFDFIIQKTLKFLLFSYITTYLKNNSIITSNDSNCNGTNNVANVEFSQDDNKNELKPALEVTNQGGEISAQ